MKINFFSASLSILLLGSAINSYAQSVGDPTTSYHRAFAYSEWSDIDPVGKLACSCPVANPDVDECSWPQVACSSRNCFVKKPAGGADCGPDFTGAYCGCAFTCQVVSPNGSSTPAHTVFTGKAVTPEVECTGSSTDLGGGHIEVCTAVKYKKKVEGDADGSGYKSNSCQ